MFDEYEKNNFECDRCKYPRKHNCTDENVCKCNYPIGECCEDNLKKNVAEICWKYDIPQTIAVALIKIIEKERERNELMYVHREYLLERGEEEYSDYECD